MKNFLHIPIGIRLISWATATRFVGWGLVEVFVPVFFLSFASNYTEAGIIRSLYDVSFLLALPVIGRLADRLSSKRIILTGLALYPFIALAYYFAGLYGAVIFLIIARCLNGIGFALDSVGKKTYMRRYAHGHVGMIFGYFDTVAYFWWLTAGLASLYLVRFFEIHELFLFIIPTTLIAIVLVSFIPHERKEHVIARRNFLKEIWIDYCQLISFIKKWTFDQKYTAILYAFTGSLYILVIFFIPLVFYQKTQSYTMVFLLTAFAALPFLLGIPLGLLADRATKKTLMTALLMAVGLLTVVFFIKVLWLMFALIFVISLCIYYSTLVLERLATAHETRSHMGSLSSAFLSVYQFAQAISPIIFGLLIDWISLPITLFLIFCLGLVVILPLSVKDTKIFDL